MESIRNIFLPASGISRIEQPPLEGLKPNKTTFFTRHHKQIPYVDGRLRTGKNGVKLDVFEVPPLEAAPCLDGCLFICDGCRKQIEEPKRMIPSYWRCLNNALYSEVPAVQVISFRLLRRLEKTGERWATELLEHAYLDPDREAWADQGE